MKTSHRSFLMQCALLVGIGYQFDSAQAIPPGSVIAEHRVTEFVLRRINFFIKGYEKKDPIYCFVDIDETLITTLEPYGHYARCYLSSMNTAAAESSLGRVSAKLRVKSKSLGLLARSCYQSQGELRTPQRLKNLVSSAVRAIFLGGPFAPVDLAADFGTAGLMAGLRALRDSPDTKINYLMGLTSLEGLPEYLNSRAGWLRRLDLSFSDEDADVVDITEEVKIKDNVVFLSKGLSKGAAIGQFFEKGLFAERPGMIIMIDDHLVNLEGVQQVCDDLRIPFRGIHYTYFKNSVFPSLVGSVDHEIFTYQESFLARDRRLVFHQEAAAALGKSISPYLREGLVSPYLSMDPARAASLES